MLLVKKINKFSVILSSLSPRLLMLIFLSGLNSCAYQKYELAPIESRQTIEYLLSRDVDEPGFIQFMQENSAEQISTQECPIQKWPLMQVSTKQWGFREITLAALYFNPQLQADFAKFNLNKAQALLLLQRKNPALRIPLEHSNIGGGISPWLIGFVFDFIYESPAKRHAKQTMAKAEIQAALMGIKKLILDLRSSLKIAWINYISALTLHDFIRDEFRLLEDSYTILQRQYELGESSYFEMNNKRLEVQRLILESHHHQVMITDHFYTLLTLIGLSPEKISPQDFLLPDHRALPEIDAISQLTIQKLALHERHDIQQTMFEYEAHEAAIRLEIEKQYPNINLSPGFVFDQDEKTWVLETSWVLPVFHHNNAQINKALAKRQLLQKQFQVLQSNLMHKLARKKERYIALINALQQASVLADGLKGKENIYQKQYNAGYTGRLDLLKNKLETLRAKRAYFAIRVSVDKSLAQLENFIQTPLQGKFNHLQIIKSLFKLNKIAEE